MAQITTAEFAAELNTDTRTARKFLRAITPKEEQPGKGSRWVLEGNKREIAKMKKRFAEWTAAQVKPEPKDEAPVETEEPTEGALEEIEDELQLDD